MFEMIPQWVQNQASQREQQKLGGLSLQHAPQGDFASGGGGLLGSGAGSNFAGIFGQTPQGTGMMDALGGNMGGTSPGMIAARGAPPRSGGGNSPLQDIAQALQLGRPISDSSWMQAGYGPGGAATSGTQMPAGGVFPISGNAHQLNIPQFSTAQQAAGKGPDNTSSQIMQGIMSAAQLAMMFG